MIMSTGTVEQEKWNENLDERLAKQIIIGSFNV